MSVEANEKDQWGLPVSVRYGQDRVPARLISGKRDYRVATVQKAMKVVEFLGRGDVLGWKSVREVAAGAGISKDEAFRLLHTLVAEKWAEQNKAGFRLAATGLMETLLYVQRYLARLARQFGVKVPGHKEE